MFLKRFFFFARNNIHRVTLFTNEKKNQLQLIYAHTENAGWQIDDLSGRYRELKAYFGYGG